MSAYLIGIGLVVVVVALLAVRATREFWRRWSTRRLLRRRGLM